MTKVLLFLAFAVGFARGTVSPLSLGWREAPDETSLERDHTLTFWLQGDDSALFDAANNIALPGSNSYRKFLSHEDLKLLISPSHNAAAQLTTRWLENGRACN